MKTEPKQKSSSPIIQRIAERFRLSGWLGFWAQVALAFVAFIALLFAWSGQAFSEEENFGINVGIFFAFSSAVALCVNIYFAYRYTRLARELRNLAPGDRPSKAESLRLLRLTLFIGAAGVLLGIFGSGSGIGVQIAKVVSQPSGIAISEPGNVVRAIDVYVVLANNVNMTAHFVNMAISLWLIDRIQRI